jgi:hypothetical protein
VFCSFFPKLAFFLLKLVWFLSRSFPIFLQFLKGFFKNLAGFIVFFQEWAHSSEVLPNSSEELMDSFEKLRNVFRVSLHSAWKIPLYFLHYCKPLLRKLFDKTGKSGKRNWVVIWSLTP